MRSDLLLNFWTYVGAGRWLVAGALTLGLAAVALARPAPWYWWESRVGASAPVCAQFMPSQGWIRGKQAYDDPQCRRVRVASPSGR